MRKKLGLMAIILMVSLALLGCGPKVGQGKDYGTYDEDTRVFILNEKAFEDAEKVKMDKIQEKTPWQLYVAKFGFSEVVYLQVIRSKGKYSEIQFLDMEYQGYMISDHEGEVVLDKVPRIMLDRDYEESLFAEMLQEGSTEGFEAFFQRAMYQWEKSSATYDNSRFTLFHQQLEEDPQYGKVIAFYSEEGHRIAIDKTEDHQMGFLIGPYREEELALAKAITSETEKEVQEMAVKDADVDKEYIVAKVDPADYADVIKKLTKSRKGQLEDYGVGDVNGDGEVDYIILNSIPPIQWYWTKVNGRTVCIM
ncbi:hypothetical protein Amet_0273 [Alkaliphilus metalliredigens QYMF]|uniref:Uncharacterized protein n=1 Tax=Alkaliphilus metalliredigens (strain QYMF) TaxID=293826 RepID=A6TJY8_ALKMQ|nr:hypothetical protein [Alkaliphilus metalliredigens]ABR46506.1 hypothetical protein Amet_0273 [Alkaliphilus metalliredigens QYMF]